MILDQYISSEPHRNQNRKKSKISPAAQHYFKNKLITEYEFYEWIKKRLFHQLQIINGDHSTHTK